MEIWKINFREIDHKLITEAAKRINQGELVIFPTETVYGVAVNLLNQSALQRIYEIKRRPEEKPLTIHIGDRSQVYQWAEVSSQAEELMDRWWPGPLTVILRAKKRVQGSCTLYPVPLTIESLAHSWGGKFGFRFPDHPAALALLEQVKNPVGAPSANRSGEPAPVTAMEAYEQLGDKVDLILDAGPTPLQQSSTIVDLTTHPPRLIREGAIPEKLLGIEVKEEEERESRKASRRSRAPLTAEISDVKGRLRERALARECEIASFRDPFSSP